MWLVEMTVPSLKMSSMNNKLILACAVASGTVIASIAAGYWLYRRRRRHGHGGPHGMILDNEDLCIPVGTVDKLWNYPLKSAHRVDLEEIQCTKRGFKHDRSLDSFPFCTRMSTCKHGDLTQTHASFGDR